VKVICRAVALTEGGALKLVICRSHDQLNHLSLSLLQLLAQGLNQKRKVKMNPECWVETWIGEKKINLTYLGVQKLLIINEQVYSNSIQDSLLYFVYKGGGGSERL
jgi:hypothetical protein